LLQRNYKLLISVAPLSNETRIITSDSLPYFGASPLVNTIWFKLFIYSITGCGPPSLLLSKGVRLNYLPQVFSNYEALMITPWGRDSGIVPISGSLLAINESATYSPILVQAYPKNSIKISNNELIYLPLPFLDDTQQNEDNIASNPFQNHPSVNALSAQINLHRICGYITLINLHSDSVSDQLGGDCHDYSQELNKWTLFDCHFGIPLFDRTLNKNVCNRILSNNLFDPIK
jgi:hypothetical protein